MPNSPGYKMSADQVVTKPNFFILGAGKSATTSLYHCLRQHPDIYLSKVKEPTFFSEYFQVINNPISYFELFDAATHQRYVGEASHTYFSDPKTPRLLSALFPEAKFVLILRNPVDRAYSLYQDMRRFGWEPIKTFEDALGAEDARFSSKRFRVSNPQSFYNFLYFRTGLYGEQLKRYLTFFNRDQFHVLTFDDFVKDTQKAVAGICQFLQINVEIDSELIAHNPSYGVRSLYLNRLAKTGLLRDTAVQRLINRFNHQELPAITSETRTQLALRYTEDQTLLHRLCGVTFDDINGSNLQTIIDRSCKT